MDNILLSNVDKIILHYSLGYGNLDNSNILFFGNEFGTSGSSTKQIIYQTIQSLKQKNYLIDPKFFNPTTNSIFLQFISRFILTKKYNNLKWLDKLSNDDKNILNNYIMNNLYKEDSCIINLRPYPRPTERVWNYQYIDQKEYLNQWKFNKNIKLNTQTLLRINLLKQIFNTNKLIIGIGDKESKLKFFKYIYPDLKFDEIKLDKHLIYVNKQKQIYLSNYFDYRCGIGLNGLKSLYQFIYK